MASLSVRANVGRIGRCSDRMVVMRAPNAASAPLASNFFIARNRWVCSLLILDMPMNRAHSELINCASTLSGCFRRAPPDIFATGKRRGRRLKSRCLLAVEEASGDTSAIGHTYARRWNSLCERVCRRPTRDGGGSGWLCAARHQRFTCAARRGSGRLRYGYARRPFVVCPSAPPGAKHAASLTPQS